MVCVAEHIWITIINIRIRKNKVNYDWNKGNFSVATHNDELYIEKPLDSIFKNTKVDFRVYGIDNGSLDKLLKS